MVVLENIRCRLITEHQEDREIARDRERHTVRALKRVLTFPAEEEVVDEGEDESDALYWVLQVAQHSVPIERQADEDSRESVQSTQLDQTAAGYLDAHAVGYQRWWRRQPVDDEVQQSEDAGGGQGREEESCGRQRRSSKRKRGDPVDRGSTSD